MASAAPIAVGSIVGETNKHEYNDAMASAAPTAVGSIATMIPVWQAQRYL
jgi:hypothetical protein